VEDEYLGLPQEITAKKINKKVKRLARKSALSIKAKQKSIVVLEDIKWDTPKTKNYLQLLEALGLSDKKSVLVLGDLNKNVYLSSRNLKNSSVVINSELNTYKISDANSLVFCEGAIAGLESILNS
jgi:large subunit ribosomal protein L4